MSKYPPMNILLGSELWEESLVAGLTRLGHTVTVLNTDDPNLVVISRSAWRIPKDVAQMKVTAHIETVLKQIRLLQHEDHTKGEQPEGSPEATAPKPARKRAVKKKPGGLPVSPPSDGETAGGAK